MNKITNELKERKRLITEILICCKANNVYVSCDLYLRLIFADTIALKNIAHELHIK